MKCLRLLLVLCLSLSVPATALTAVVSLTQCEQLHARTGTLSLDPEHAMHSRLQQVGEHAQHTQHGSDAAPADLRHCGHCSSGHCASANAATLAVGTSPGIINCDCYAELPLSRASRTAAAHSLELIRPPSLT